MARTLSAAKVALYEKMLRQLQDDGFGEEAQTLQQKLKLHPREDKDALLRAVERAQPTGWQSLVLEAHPPLRAGEPCLSIAADAVHRSRPPKLARRYWHQSKGAVMACAFAADQKTAASGTAEGGVQVFSTSKMRPAGGAEACEETNPAILASFTDHTAAVTALSFHPRQPTLVSGSLDTTAKVFDLANPGSAKRAVGVLNDVYGVLSLQVHPSGDYVLSATAHPRIRLHDLETLQCFAAMQAGDDHTNSVHDVRYSSDGRAFASASADGTVALWDAVSHRRVNQLLAAHQGQPVHRVCWSRNLQYLLTAGTDNRVRLWDLRSTGEELLNFGAMQPASTESVCAAFAAHEQYVVVGSQGHVPDLVLYDARTGVEAGRGGVFGSGSVRCLDASEDALLAGSEDGLFRLLDVES